MSVQNFVQSRKIVEAKEKGLREKVMHLDKVCELIKDGDTLYIGGTYYSRTPMSMIWALIKRKKKNLTMIRTIACHEAELLAVSGVIKKIISSWIGIDAPPRTSRVLRKYIEQGILEYEEWGHSDLAYRLLGGMLGVPFLPSLSMMGSDLCKQLNVVDYVSPFTNEKVLLIPSLFPDVTIVHAHKADSYGNAQIFGMKYVDKEAALAANKVIITCEEIVSSNKIRETPEKTIIPYFCVDAVVEAPFGCFPHECQYRYECDLEHITEYSRLSLEKEEDYVNRYLEQYVYSTDTFLEYLDKFRPNSIINSVMRMRKILWG